MNNELLFSERNPLNPVYGYQASDRMFQSGITQGKFSAGAYGVIRRTDQMIASGRFAIGTVQASAPVPEFVAYRRFYGHHATPGDSCLVRQTGADSLFDIASITKSIPVALLVLWAVSQKYISLDDSVTHYISALSVGSGPIPTIENLLRYQVEFRFANGLERPYSNTNPEEIRRRILHARISTSEFRYSNFPPIILAMILERVTCRGLSDLARSVLFDPLGVNAVFHSDAPSVESPGNSRFVCTELHEGKPLEGIVHDELTRYSCLPGAAGLFASVDDLLRLTTVILNHGMIGDKQLIRGDLILRLGMSDPRGDTDPQHTKFGLGVGVWDEFAKGYGTVVAPSDECDWQKGAFFKMGFTGVVLACFPAIGAAVVVLTNGVHPQRPQSSAWLNRFRYNAVLSALFGVLPHSDA